ncbi:hypothetical protein [Bacillus thuringiensis]|uniref:hypothetical protein n=2 Tax=Bacillus TaxID=1386 RepID=UPI001E36C132|nr:hypothetical protein [Bacillus thuringiensis]
MIEKRTGIESASGIVKIPNELNSESITIKGRKEFLHISLLELNSDKVIQTNNVTLIYQEKINQLI